MRGQDKKRRIALLLAVLMILMNCIPSYASINGTENSTGSDVYESGADITSEIQMPESEETETAIVEGDYGSEKENGENTVSVEESRREVSILNDDGEVEVDNEWHTFGGVLWNVSVNEAKLSISANSEAINPGVIPSIGYGEPVAWNKYASIIREVEFSNSKVDPNVKVTEIGDFAFANLEKLATISIPGSVEKIGYGAFMGCKSLSTISVAKNDRFVTSDTGILYKKDGEGLIMLFAPLNRPENDVIEISENTVEIGSYSVIGGSCYTGEVIIPKGCKKIGQQAFKGCDNIDSVVIGNRYYGTDINTDKCTAELTTIASGAFDNCHKLKYIYIPSSLTTIALRCFTQDNNLQYLYYYSIDPDLDTYDELTAHSSQHSPNFPNIEIPNGEVVYIPWNHCIVRFTTGISVVYDNNANPRLRPICVKYKTPLSVTGTIRKTLYVLQKDGYEFLGWMRKQASDLYDVDEEVVTDFDLSAQWAAYFKLTFNTGTGEFKDKDESTGSKKSAVRSISANHSLPEEEWPQNPIPKNKDAEFVGWQLGSKPNGTILLENKNDVRASGFTNKYYYKTYRFDAQDWTLNAVYSEYPSITFWDEYGTKQLGSKMTISFNSYMTDEQKAIIDSISMNYWHDQYNSDPAYVFDGWWSSAEGKGSRLRTGNMLYSAMPRKYYIHFNHYLKMTYYYGYDVEGNGDDTGKVVEEGILSKKDYYVRVPKAREGYVFRGWWNTKDDSGKKYDSTITANKNDNDLILYAHWEKLCTVSLNRKYEEVYDEEYLNKHPEMLEIKVINNVVSGNVLYYDYLIPYDTRTVDPVSGPLKEEGDRLKFAGWYTEDGKRIESTTPIREDMVLYARWAKGFALNYKVIARFTGAVAIFWGTVLSPGQQIQIPPAEVGLPDPLAYNYRGYIFDGWKDENGNPPDTTKKISQDMEYFAQWYDDPNDPNDPQVTVSFNTFGGPEVQSRTVSVNTYLEEPDHGTWTDHKFIGWYKDPGFTEEWDFLNNKITEDMYLYARWIYWTDEMEAEYQDNLKGIYWVKVVRNEKLPLDKYFKESGLKYTYDSEIVRFNKRKRIVKGKKVGSTLITAKRSDGSDYKYGVRVFVVLQELQDMYAFSTNTTINAVEYLTVSGFLPDRWQSSNTKVASIDPKSGIIKVRGRGKSVIKAFYKDRPVKATLYSEVPKFSKPFVIMKTGQTKKLKIKKLKRYDIVSWNVVSQDSLSGGRVKSIGTAEIDDNGRITALTAGDVTVYANVYGQVISCKVHIEPPILRTSSLVLDVNKTKKLKLKRTKLKYVEWTSTDDQIAYVDPVNGTVYALQPGRVVLKTTAGGVTNTCNIQVVDPELLKKKNKKK